ncbi:hypothetical protein PFICI_06545 [Pestalotiopsis fici W106-1]|uniref:Xylanolytic transcriptional activator regulatory domain-containing protein n=1 Tax=Pestalotiopsis fici (strain W106-1 / CGMCC3.15140) TaxID=1229662 RepID=W3X5Y6_PESFW|nr:uncharacterized protein PFICI_06545 [Pestalotiopsis fici W106-1]ETS81543.1 hypothetical protein PFICI_06545 [Pestalotiopsis fici W106-1]
MGEIGFLSRSAMAEPRSDRFERLPTNLTSESVLLASLALDGSDPSKSNLSDHQATQLLASEPSRLRMDRASTLPHMTRFVEEICPIMPYLVASNLTDQYEEVLSQHGRRGNIENQSSSALSRFNVCMAVATGALLSSRSPGKSLLVIRLHEEAIKQLSMIKMKDETHLVSCILSLTIFALYSPSGGSSWHLVGLALRKCISQGWHRHQECVGQLTEGDLLSRKRLFWSAYMIDRSLSLVIGRPFSIQDRDISISVLKPTEATSLHCHLITQARLATDIQVSCRTTLLHDYSNICFWKQWTGDQDRDSNVKPTVLDHLLQLECRMLAKITSTQPGHQSPGRHSAAVVREVERETIEACARYIDRSYERLQENNFVGSFIEAYDMFTASLTVVHLKRRDAACNTQQQLASMMDLINKSSTLLTAIAERFSVFRSFQRVLLSLSGHLMANPIPTAQVRY